MARVRPVLLPFILLAGLMVLLGSAQQPREYWLLPTENTYGKRLALAREALTEDRLDDALELVQSLLDEKEDIFLPVTVEKDGKKSQVWRSIHDEAEAVLADLPPGNRGVYRRRVADKADKLTEQAQKDPELLPELIRRFRFTDPGWDAEMKLARQQFEAGNYLLAARSYQRLAVYRSDLTHESWEPRDRFRAAAAFYLIGDPVTKDRFWKSIPDPLPQPPFGAPGLTIKREDLQNELERLKAHQPSKPQADWPLYRGNPARDAQGIGGPAYLEQVWKHEMSHEKESSQTTMEWLKRGMSSQFAKGMAVLPSFFPVAVPVETGTDTVPMLLFRSYWGVEAVDVRSGKLKWDSDSRWSADKMARDSKRHPFLTAWVQQWINMGRHNLLWENSVTGTLSTNGRYVYVVEDLQVPPFFHQNPYARRQPEPYMGGIPIVTEAIQHSELHTYDVRVGKLVWHLGGVGEKKDDPANELRDAYFLGPPLPVKDRLYVLIEKHKQLRLVCLDAARNPERENPVVWSQALSDVRSALTWDVGRRTRALSLAYAQGILVCPTNDHTVFGIDPRTRRILWSRIYTEEPAPARPPLPPGVPPPGAMVTAGQVNMPSPDSYHVSAPAIVEDKVVFTARDDPRIHCIRLKDGTPVWTAPRADDDLYFAGVWAGKVVLVTKQSVRALNLADGKAAWREVRTGMPSGQGTASDDVYYLPLEKGADSKKPEICAIDLGKGVIVGRQQAAEPPGNLLFFNNLLVTQGVTRIEAFPLLKAKQEEVERRVRANPKDLAARLERGELRQASGDRAGAIEDLRAVFDAEKQPPELRARVRRTLHTALAAALREDFNANEKFLPLLEKTCEVEPGEVKDRADETAQRRLDYFTILGQGREKQGKSLEALEAYRKAAGQGANGEWLKPAEEPALSAKPGVWAAGRIHALLAQAMPAQRELLEKRIQEEWARTRESGGLEALRAFVAAFDVTTRAGREARLLLAERLDMEAGTTTLLEAELALLPVIRQKHDPATAGRAAEALALLLIKKGFLTDAVHYYRLLNRDFGTVTIRDGETGADLYREAMTDKRLLPYFDPTEPWSGKVKVSQEQGTYARPSRLFHFEVEGDHLPYFRQHRLALNIDFHEFRVTDPATKEEWKKNLERGGNNQFSALVFNQNTPGMARFPARTLGHLIVLQLAHMAYGIDPVNKEMRWAKNLVSTNGYANGGALLLDPHDGGIEVVTADGYRPRLGVTMPAESDGLYLQTLDGLVAVHPLTGEPRWTRSDVRGNRVVFGDAETLFVVELNREGRAARTQAIRARDGGTVDVPDFVSPYQNRVRTLGHQLLVKDTTPNSVTLRLYDLLTGKDVWKRDFPADSHVLQCEDAGLCGAVDPTGRVTVLDSHTEKVLLESKIDAKYVGNALAIHLLQDREFNYLAVQEPIDPKVNPFDGPYPNVAPDTGVRQLPVNGWLFAFARDTGRMKWRTEMRQLMLLMEEYKDLPLLVFTSRYLNPLGPGGRFGAQQTVAIRIVNKRTGKLVFDRPDVLNSAQFHTYALDAHAGRIELIASNYKVAIVFEKQ